MTEGMGYVCDRSEEHLGSSDVAIIHMRRTLLRLLDNMQKGIEPYAATHPELYRVQPLDVVSDFAELDKVLEEYRIASRRSPLGLPRPRKYGGTRFFHLGPPGRATSRDWHGCTATRRECTVCSTASVDPHAGPMVFARWDSTYRPGR